MINDKYKELQEEFYQVDALIELLQEQQKEHRIENGSYYEYEESYYEIGDRIEKLQNRLWQLDDELDELLQGMNKIERVE